MQANHNKPKSHKPARRPAYPRQICVSSKKNSKPDTQKRQEPKQKHPQKGFAKGHSGLTLRHAQKHAEMNCPPRNSVKHGNRNIVHTFVSIEEKKCTWSRAYKLPRSASSQMCLCRRPQCKGPKSSILCRQECRSGHCTKYPPAGGIR